MKTEVKNDVLTLHHACSKDPTRSNLQAVHVRPDGWAEATDGSALALIPTEPCDESVLIPSDIAKAGTKLGGRDFAHQLVEVVNGEGTVELRRGGRSVGAPIPAEQKYPATDEITGPVKERKPHFEIALDAAKLLRLARALGMGGKVAIVKLSLGDDETEPILVSVNRPDDGYGVLMPCRF